MFQSKKMLKEVVMNLRSATPADLDLLRYWDEQPHVVNAKNMPKIKGNEMMIHLRPSTSADLELLEHWDEQPHIIDSDPNDDWHWELELDRTPEWREQLIAELDGRPIGFIQIIDPEREDSHYWGNVPANLRAIDIWIGEETDLGKGYGTRMMQLALARCFADSTVTAVLIDPLANNTRAHRFYERLGFQFLEPRRFGDDDCFVYRLNRADWRPEVRVHLESNSR